MAIQVFDGGFIRPNCKITVTKAEFQNISNNDTALSKRVRPSVTRAQIKVAQSAVAQALAWNDEGDIGISKRQGLRIVVLEGMFHPHDFNDPSFSDELEADIATECEKYGEIEKITIFSKNPRGVVVVKFKTAFAAQECIRAVHGRFFGGNQLKCYFWDGTTNFSQVPASVIEQEEKEEEARIDEFGDWLEKEQENLPEEFQLKTE